MKFIKLIRLQNLFIIAYTMYAVRHLVLSPILTVSGFELQLSETCFALIVFSIMLISAAGYIINDYFDINVDSVNKPHRVLVKRTISKNKAILLHLILSFLGLILSAFVSIKIGHWKFSLIFLFAIFMLLTYSMRHKRQFMIGNIIIAFLAGLIPIIPLIFELPLLADKYIDTNGIINDFNFLKVIQKPLLIYSAGFAVFAFALNFIREIIKDIEDIEGDKNENYKTIPIIIGVMKTKILISILILTFISFLIKFMFFTLDMSDDIYSSLYLIIFIALSLVIIGVLLFFITEKKQFKRLSLFLKIIMFLGISYSVLFYLIINTHLLM